jgi:hypothetical protein
MEEPITQGIVFERHPHSRPISAAFPLTLFAGAGLARGAIERVVEGEPDRHPV